MAATGAASAPRMAVAPEPRRARGRRVRAALRWGPLLVFVVARAATPAHARALQQTQRVTHHLREGGLQKVDSEGHVPRFAPPPPPPGPVLTGDALECENKRKQLTAEFTAWVNLHPHASTVEVSMRNHTFQVHMQQSSANCVQEFAAKRRDEARHRHYDAVRLAKQGLSAATEAGAAITEIRSSSSNRHRAGEVVVHTHADGVVRPAAGENSDDVQAWEAVIPRIVDKARAPSIAIPSEGRVVIAWAESSAFSKEDAAYGKTPTQSRLAFATLDTHNGTAERMGKFEAQLLDEEAILHQPGSSFQRFTPVLWSDMRSSVLRVIFGADVDPLQLDADARPEEYAFADESDDKKTRVTQKIEAPGEFSGKVEENTFKGKLAGSKMHAEWDELKPEKVQKKSDEWQWKAAQKAKIGLKIKPEEAGTGMGAPEDPILKTLVPPPPSTPPVEEEPRPMKRELHILMSTDAGVTWSVPDKNVAARRIDAPFATLSSPPVGVLTGGHDTLFVSGGLTRTFGPATDWLLPATLHEDPSAIAAEGADDSEARALPTYAGAMPGNDFAPYAAILRTSDDGMAFSKPEFITRPGDDLIAPSLLVTRDGRVVAFLADTRRNRGRIHRTESADAGKTWATPVPTNLPSNGEPVGVCELVSGKIAAVFSNALAPDSAPVSIALSTDGGITFKFVRDLENTWAGKTSAQRGGTDDDGSRPYGPGACVGTGAGPHGSVTHGISMVHVVHARSTPRSARDSLLYKTFPETWIEEGSGHGVGVFKGARGFRRRAAGAARTSVVLQDATTPSPPAAPLAQEEEEKVGKTEFVEKKENKEGEESDDEDAPPSSYAPPPPKLSAYEKYAMSIGLELPSPPPRSTFDRLQELGAPPLAPPGYAGWLDKAPGGAPEPWTGEAREGRASASEAADKDKDKGAGAGAEPAQESESSSESSKRPKKKAKKGKKKG